jgi:hypothetical protein
MLFEHLNHVPLTVWALAFVSGVVGWLAKIRYRPVLRKYNGPFLASFSDLHRLLQLYFYPDRVNYIGLDEKYGEIIRLGPRTLVFATPDAIKDIYATGFRKALHPWI